MQRPAPPSAVHTGTHDDQAIKKVGAVQLPHGIRIQSWTITSCKRPIIGDKEVERYQAELGNVLTVPEILFGNSHLTLHHAPSGVAIRFLALDALKEWKQENLPPLKVQVASAWQKAREKEIQAQNAIILEYDWTYTTPYTGTLMPKWQEQEEDSSTSSSASTAPSSASSTDAAAAEGAAAAPQQDQEQQTAAGSAAAPEWQPTEEQIDRNLLMQREPILYYDEIPLYESELDDNGTCQLVAKLRVMPRCWYVLLRLWLKVDGSMARLRETRLFCRFDQPGECHVLREIRHCEGHFDELRAAGAPPEGPSYADADSAAAVFNAIAPVGMTKYELSRLVLKA